ncbi:MAG: hypothetical protein E6767_18930 [Dysgonomonas sp.]|nr:hypothetical protein [Dysgonomonas sp.]
MKGILLDGNDDLLINVKRDTTGKITSGLVVGERMVQDAYITLSINQGELKEDPIAGANLLTMIRGKENKEKMRKTIEIALQRVGIRFDDIKDQLEMRVNKQVIDNQ